MAAGGAFGAVQLDHEFLVVFEVAGQAGAVAAGALDRSHSQWCVPVGELDQLLVAVGGGRDGDLVGGGAGPGVHHRRSVGVDMRVDPMTMSTTSVRLVMRSSIAPVGRRVPVRIGGSAGL
ncbi:hypothetical protein GCM10023147_18730 [Tsukamurella soli]|uniref:Uncharacterized protein n=1 Tax=Tsukamurella soli TaxID=644556 RepID=A0ABP8JGZ3_9ACTN